MPLCKCPHCSKHLVCLQCHKGITAAEIQSAAARMSNAARLTHAGPPKVYRQCPRCGKQHSAREMQKCRA